MEYTFDDDELFMQFALHSGCHQEFASHAHRTKGLGVISSASHWPSRARIYNGHNEDPASWPWSFLSLKNNPYVDEWKHLIAAIRTRKYNEVERGCMASIVTSMGRMAAHTGQEITLEQIMMNCEHEFAPDIQADSGSPILLKAPRRKIPNSDAGLEKKYVSTRKSVATMTSREVQTPRLSVC